MTTTTSTVPGFQISGPEAAAIMVGLAVVTVVTGLLVFLIYRMLIVTTRVRSDMGVALLVAVVVILTILGFLVLQNEELITLASVGLGALAGAVSSAWRIDRPRSEDPPDPPPDV